MQNRIFYILLMVAVCLCFQNGTAQHQYQDSDVINIEIHTGELNNAGTNKEHLLTLYFEGRKEGVQIKLLKHIDGNGLERGTVDKFSKEIPKLGKLLRISIKQESPDLTQWYLHKIVITNDMGTRYKFNCNCWVSQYMVGVNTNEIYPSSITDTNIQQDTYSMKVAVKTGDKSGAGTNANVYLTLATEAGNSTPLKLNSRISGNAFESDDTDVIFINHDVFEELKSINIRHDNKGVGAGWFLDHISITTPDEKNLKFECNCWLEGENNVRKLRPKS